MNAPRMAVNLTPPLLLPEEVHNTRGEGLPGRNSGKWEGTCGRKSGGIKDPMTSSVEFPTW